MLASKVERPSRPRDCRHPAVDAALSTIARDCHSSTFSLSELAKDVRLSRWYLDRLLVKQTGAGFRHHVRLARLAHGEHDLIHTNLSVKEIAYRVGYRYVTVFVRDFKSQYGNTPLRWRRARLSGQ